jgi:hypothetical protein
MLQLFAVFTPHYDKMDFGSDWNLKRKEKSTEDMKRLLFPNKVP